MHRRMIVGLMVAAAGCVAETGASNEEAFAAEGGALRYVTASVRSFGYGGGSGRIDVVVPPGEPWSASSSAPFLSITRGAGTGPGIVEYTVGFHSGSARLGKIIVAGRTVTVMQQGYPYRGDAFEDFPPTEEHVPYAELMRELGLTRGCQGPPSAWRYCPRDAATRGQAAVFVVRALSVRAGLAPDAFSHAPAPYFPADTPESHVFFRWVQRLRELGITSGCGAGAYCPDQPVTAAQLAVFVVRALHGDAFESRAEPYFTDVPATHFAFRHVQKLRALGVWDGCGGGRFCPDAALTRAEVAAIVMRAFFDAPRESGRCTASCASHPCGGGDGCGATCDTGSGCAVASGIRSASVPLHPPELPWDDSLASNRSRLFHQWAMDQARDEWGCMRWYTMSRSEQNVFLTITDRLQRTRLGNGRSALWHVNKIHAIRGHERDGACGGIDYNRLYVQVDHILHDALRTRADNPGHVTVNGAPVLMDDSFEWRPSEDMAGPHRPFDLSIETVRGGPRAQLHFFRDPEAGAGVSLAGRAGVESVRDGYLVEIDQDYNIPHDSSTECRYGPLCFLGIGCRTGAEMYRDMVRGASDTLNFLPCDCPVSGNPADAPLNRCAPTSGPPGPPPSPPSGSCWPLGFPCFIDRDCCSGFCSYPDPERGSQYCVYAGGYFASRPPVCGDDVCEPGRETTASCSADCAVSAGPRIDPGGVVNASTYGSVRRGDIIAIFGSGFGAIGNVVELTGATGTSNEGRWSAHWFESPGQINVLLPAWATGGPVTARVWNGSAWSGPETFTVAP